MPAWRSILVLAGAFCLAWLFEEIKRRGEAGGGTIKHFFSQCLFEFFLNHNARNVLSSFSSFTSSSFLPRQFFFPSVYEGGEMS